MSKEDVHAFAEEAFAWLQKRRDPKESEDKNNETV
jgi:hypothetical protein